ncbi:MAG: hypothetical protein ACXVBB_22765 [Isosphaeraceae bacterium]
MKQIHGAQYEISVDGVPRTYRDRKDIALQSAQFLKSGNANSVVKLKDLQTGEGSLVAFKPGDLARSPWLSRCAKRAGLRESPGIGTPANPDRPVARSPARHTFIAILLINVSLAKLASARSSCTSVAVSAGLAGRYGTPAPTVSAITAPRAPSGLANPTVESCAV